jgi:hypothetical protein
MKRGVCTTPWGVWKQPQRAWLWLQRAVTSNWKLAAVLELAVVAMAAALRSWGERLMGTAWCCP